MLVGDDEAAKDTKLLMMLPWVHVYFMHRHEENIFSLFLFRAMPSASLRTIILESRNTRRCLVVFCGAVEGIRLHVQPSAPGTLWSP